MRKVLLSLCTLAVLVIIVGAFIEKRSGSYFKRTDGPVPQAVEEEPSETTGMPEDESSKSEDGVFVDS